MVDAVSIINQFVTYTLITLGILLFFGIIYLVWDALRFKYSVIVRAVTNNRKFVIVDKARNIKIQGVRYWRLKQLKRNIPVPPPEAIEITKKGRYFVEAYLTHNDEIKFIKDVHDTSTDKGGFEPLTTEQRVMLIQELAEADSLRKKSLLDHLPLLMSGMIFIVMIIVVVVFFKEVTAPAVQVSASNAEISASNAKMLEEIKQIRIGNFTQTIQGVPVPD